MEYSRRVCRWHSGTAYLEIINVHSMSPSHMRSIHTDCLYYMKFWEYGYKFFQYVPIFTNLTSRKTTTF